MCIVCEIKKLLGDDAASPAVMRRVELLAAVSSGLLDMADNIAEGKGVSRRGLDELRVMAHSCFSDDPEAKKSRDKAMRDAETEASKIPEGMREFGELLGALFGAKVEHVVVIPQDGEGIDEAIARTMQARSNEPTKH